VVLNFNHLIDGDNRDPVKGYENAKISLTLNEGPFQPKNVCIHYVMEENFGKYGLHNTNGLNIAGPKINETSYYTIL